MWLILQAIEFGGKLRNEHLHLQELGIATHSSLFVNANRDPNKSAPAKPSDFFYFKPTDDDSRVPTVAADVVLRLIQDQKLPGWCMDVIPLDKVKASANRNSSMPDVRAWVGSNALIICPHIRDLWVTAPFAVFYRTVKGVVMLEDIDRPECTFKVKLPSDEPRWTLEAELELVEDDELRIIKELSSTAKKTFGRSLVN